MWLVLQNWADRRAQDGVATQYVLVCVPRRGERLGHREGFSAVFVRGLTSGTVCVSRMQFRIDPEVGEATSLRVGAISCRVETGSGVVAVDVLDGEFFDEESLVLVLKASAGGDGRGTHGVALMSGGR